MTKYDLEYLEEKLGPFNKDYQYPNKPISGFNLTYIETKTKKDLDEKVKEIKNEMNPGYIWGYVQDTKAIYVTRAFGENRIFIYNPNAIKKTDYVKGKLKVLNSLTSDNINELFDQKAVFDYFYRKLWDLRLDLGKEIRDKNDISDNKALMAAQHIIDRIIFTYFICEKELVTLNGEIPLDSKTLFNSIAKIPDPWKCIKNLFFEQFAKKESKPLLLGKNAQIITPYLNGGLFRPKTIEGISELDLKIEYTREQWQELFEPLNKYTWIIEDEIPDHEGTYEGNLTPEIIGHIYEKFVITIETLDEIKLDELKISKKGDLQKGNKKIGAYYTPEQITDYISRNTIKPLLYQKIGITEKFVFSDFLKNSNSEILNKALNILNEITICDPACGSGAFLIKSGEILLEYKKSILKQLEKNIDKYYLKKEIIIKNLYGVDIQEGAVEICKLRLWLWLISSSKNQKVEPLPNIEYNFLVGNSLVGWTNENLEQNVLVHVDKMVLVILDALKLRYKSGNIDEIKEKLLKTDMQSYAEAMSLLKNIYTYSTEDEAEQLKNIIETIKNKVYKEINRIFYDYIESSGTKISLDAYKEFNPLHWKVDFNHIFKLGGFDVIIGNPPYVRYQSIKEIKPFLKGNYSSYTGTSDLYVYFFERGISILKEFGMFSFISSNKFTKSNYGKKLRILILSFSLLEYIDLTGEKIFESATVDPCVIIIKKEYKSTNQVFINNKYFIPQNRLDEDSWSFHPLEILDLRDKIRSKGNKIKNINGISIYYGIKTANDKAFVIDSKTKNSLIKKDSKIKDVLRPTIGGRDINKYNIEFRDQYLLYIPWGFPIKKYPVLKEYLMNFKDTLENRSGVKDGNYKWYELHRYAPGYYDEFLKEKIIWSELSGEPSFSKDSKKLFPLASVFLMVLENKEFQLEYFLTLLNSNLLFWLFKHISNVLGGKGFRYFKQYVEELPIYPANNEEQKFLSEMAKKMLDLNYKLNEQVKSFRKHLENDFEISQFSKKLDNYYYLHYNEFIKEMKKKGAKFNSKNLEDLEKTFNNSLAFINPILSEIENTENEINFMIYKLYDLTDEEIRVVEETIK